MEISIADQIALDDALVGDCNEATQLYGAIFPMALTNEDIRNSESYKEYYAMASGTIPPKTKGSKKKATTDIINSTKLPPTQNNHKKKPSRNTQLSCLVVLVQRKDTVLHREFPMHMIMTRQDDEDDDDHDDDEKVQDANEHDVDKTFKKMISQITDDESYMKRILMKMFLVISSSDEERKITSDNDSSSVSSGFVSNMLNPNQDTGVDDIFRQHTEATSLIDTSVADIMEPSFTAQINRPPTPHPIVIQTQQPPIMDTSNTTSSLLQNLPNFCLVCFSSIPSTVEQYLANKSRKGGRCSPIEVGKNSRRVYYCKSTIP
ncbi:hypothetical protein Tco_0463068 [Tanacetum coccineum]